MFSYRENPSSSARLRGVSELGDMWRAMVFKKESRSQNLGSCKNN